MVVVAPRAALVFSCGSTDAYCPRIGVGVEGAGQEEVTIVTPLETEPWGERYFQMADPNGVIYQFVQWVTPTDPQYAD